MNTVFKPLALCMLLTACNAQTSQTTCSRGLSRQVRKYLVDEIYPALDADANQLSRSCQLSPTLDLYGDQENHKEEINRREWKCNYCGKRFNSEFYIDRHMSNKHPDNITTNGVCLADLCPIFGCKDTKSTAYSSRKARAAAQRNPYVDDFEKCSEATIEKSKYRCEILAKRCFSGLYHRNGDDMSHWFEDTVCTKLHCEGGIVAVSLNTSRHPTR